MKRSLLALSMLGCAAAAMLATGCTKAQPPRSFVQPNALRKADFTGTWYYNPTVIDAPPTNGVFYEGSYGSLEKIKWVITEDTLFAVRAYPWVYDMEAPQTPGTPHENPDGSTTYEGEPLGAWKITSHFDIIRDYNPSTGEETNRIIESQERPWNEREYMRVDWSQNLVPDYSLDTFAFLSADAAAITPVSYFVSDPTSPDALHVERADTNDSDLGFQVGEMNYLDFTDEVIAQPNMETFNFGDGDIESFPSCFLYYGTDDCAAQKVKIRYAFAKQAPNDTYEKRRWDGVDQQYFGFFTTDLLHFWDPHYGDTYSGDQRFAERFNFYVKSCNTPGTTCEAPHRVRDLNPADPYGTATWLTRFTDPMSGRNIPEDQALAAGTADPSNGIPAIDNTDPSTGKPVAVSDDYFLWQGTDGVTLTVPPKADPKNPGFNEHWSFNPQTGVVTYSDGSTTTFQGDDNWIPPANRQIKTIPYYSNVEMPEQIWKYSQEVINQWNNVFKVAYQDETGKAADQDIFVWCHNPVYLTAQNGDPADPPACSKHLKPKLDANGNPVTGADGQPVLEVRQGDPRYSMILWLPDYMAPFLGLGPAMSDPETGETISAKANINGADLDMYAAQMRDVLLLQEGRLDPNTYTQGLQVQASVQGDDVKPLDTQNVSAWVQLQQGLRKGLGVAHAPRTESQIAGEASRMNFDWAKVGTLGPVDTSSPRALAESLDQREGRMNQIFGPSLGDQFQARLNTLRNTPTETMLATPELLQNAGLDPRTDFASLGSTTKAIYSPLDSESLRKARREFRERVEAFGFDFEPFSYGVTAGEAQRYQNTSPTDIENDLIRRIYIAVTLHEVGHDMGLRHNFRASWDAMNYFPGYWQQRDQAAVALNGGSHELYARSNPKGAVQPSELAPTEPPNNEGPLAITQYDPGEISELGQQYSSIMDYGAAFNTDSSGLGRYDIAAIKYGYANNVEVFKDAKTDTTTLDKLASVQAFQFDYGYPSPLLITGNNFQAINYYTYPDMMNSGVDGIQQRRDVNVYSVDDRVYGQGLTLQAALDSNGNLQPEVPYYFCSDEFVGNLSCQLFDFGADAYEQASDIIQRYWNYYLINNFKRDKYTFHTFGLGDHYSDYIYERYFQILQDQMQWYVLLRADYTNYNASLGQSSSNDQLNAFLADDENGWGSFTAAVNDGFQLFGDVLTAPQAGTFSLSDDGLGNKIYKQTDDRLMVNGVEPSGSQIQLDITQGRYETTAWNYAGCGYYWGDDCQSRIGYFVDKWLAMQALSDSTAYFLGRDTSTDVRQYQIGYWLPYKNQILDLYGAMFSGNWSKLAPYELPNGQGMARYDFTTGGLHGPDGAPMTAPAGAPRVDPELGFSAQMWGGLFAQIGFNSTFDQSFIDSSRIFLVGNGEAPVPDSSLLNADGTPGPLATTDPTQIKGACIDRNNCGSANKDWLIWTDPISSKTYAAHSTYPVISGCTEYTLPLPPNANSACATNPLVRQDLAAEMLGHANALYQRTPEGNNPAPSTEETPDVARYNYQQFVENLDMMRSLDNLGYGYYFLDTSGG